MVKKLYCTSLDRFVSIREFSSKDIDSVFKDAAAIPSKKHYYNVVITLCVVDYLADIVRRIEDENTLRAISDIIHDELYHLCVKVNPELDIKTIRVPSRKGEEISLLGSAEMEELGKYTMNCSNLEQRLGEQVIGQDDAIVRISRNIKRAAVGLRDPRRPIGSYSFVGQTGVGKTELAKALSRCLFGDEETTFVRIDCSEYSQSHEYSKLIGAPPGYIGHNDGGQLTEAMKNKTRAVVLFDEIEKAHRKVHNILLQIMDDGTVTDGKGQKIKFKDSIVIMTSNVGADKMTELGTSIGFDREKGRNHQRVTTETMKDFEKQFSPEFVNRIDDIIVFQSLTDTDKVKIVQKMLEETKCRAGLIGIILSYDKSIANFIVDSVKEDRYGARPFRRAVEKLIEFPLAEKILENAINKPDRVKMYIKTGEIRIKRH